MADDKLDTKLISEAEDLCKVVNVLYDAIKSEELINRSILTASEQAIKRLPNNDKARNLNESIKALFQRYDSYYYYFKESSSNFLDVMCCVNNSELFDEFYDNNLQKLTKDLEDNIDQIKKMISDKKDLDADRSLLYQRARTEGFLILDNL
jgi:hypothetical protein